MPCQRESQFLWGQHMKHTTVPVADETQRLTRRGTVELDSSVSVQGRQFLHGLGSNREITVTDGKETETALVRRCQRLREVLADFDARKVGVSERQARDELYDEAIHGPDALR